MNCCSSFNSDMIQDDDEAWTSLTVLELIRLHTSGSSMFCPVDTNKLDWCLTSDSPGRVSSCRRDSWGRRRCSVNPEPDEAATEMLQLVVSCRRTCTGRREKKLSFDRDDRVYPWIIVTSSECLTVSSWHPPRPGPCRPRQGRTGARHWSVWFAVSASGQWSCLQRKQSETNQV